MPVYETVFMARQDLSESQVDELIKHFSKIIEAGSGKIIKTEYWGLLNLAYRIKKAKKAHYVLIESESPGPAIHELERTLRLHEDIMRALTIRLEEPSEGASPLVKKSNDDYEKEAA